MAGQRMLVGWQQGSSRAGIGQSRAEMAGQAQGQSRWQSHWMELEFKPRAREALMLSSGRIGVHRHLIWAEPQC